MAASSLPNIEDGAGTPLQARGAKSRGPCCRFLWVAISLAAAILVIHRTPPFR